MRGQRTRWTLFVSLGLAVACSLAGLSLLVGGCEADVPFVGKVVTGSGNLETQEFSFTDFKDLVITSSFNVTVTQSSEFGVSVTADDNILELIAVKMTGTTLSIGLDGTARVTDATLEATITLPTLTGLDVSGATHATLSGFSSTEALALVASGASSITGEITAGAADFEVSGASTIELTGTATELVADVSGASHMQLGDFVVTHADVVVSGASEAVVNLTGRLDAEVSGASHLQYVGEPTMGDVNTSGASSIGPK